VQRVASATIAIFGAGGDLTRRLIVPALCHLVRARELPDDFTIIGVDHNDRTTDQWRQMMADAIAQGASGEKEVCSWLVERMQYMRGDFTEPETFDRLAKLLADR